MIYNFQVSPELIFDILRILLAVSLYFVWVVRYENITKEFRDDYKLPDWLRDMVGILKLACAGMILTNNPELQTVALTTIALLMVAAVGTHVRIKNPPTKALPALTLFIFCMLMLFIVV